MGALKGLGPRSVDRLRTLEGSLGLLEQLHEELPRRRVHAEPYVNAVFHAGALLAGQTNLTSVFAEITNEAARALVAQVVVAFFAWDPLSLLAPDRDFDQKAADRLAIMKHAESVGESARRNAFHILKETQPLHVREEVIFYSLLHVMRRPLAFLYATGRAGELLARTEFAPLSLDALIQERHATSPHPTSGRPYARQLLLQCQCAPLARASALDEKLAALGVDVLSFAPEDVFASFDGGDRVLDHVRTKWNWRQLEELAAYKLS